MERNRIHVRRKLKTGPESREPFSGGMNGRQLDGPDHRECYVGEDVPILYIVSQDGG